jgi:hypothetical protein
MAVNQKNESPGKVKFDRGAAYYADSKGNKKNVGSLAEGLALEADCGCGITCGCYSYLTLKDYNSTTGAVTYKALYLVNGVAVIGSVESAKAAIDVIKAI